MITWLTAHLATILISLLLVLIVAAILWGMRRDRKKGRHPSCGGNCGCCPMGGSCHKD